MSNKDNILKGDERFVAIVNKVKEEGCIDKNPRPRYLDGVPAHTYSINHILETYDLSKGELPLTTLRPIATKGSIAEIIWIYAKKSNDLVEFDRLLGKDDWEETHEIHNWWKDWALRDSNGNYILNEKGHPTIGACYGEVIRRHNLIEDLLEGLKNDPDGRRHIIDMWQVEDYKEAHGLKPCAFLTDWNVVHGEDGDYLDMILFQRSSDYATAGQINQFQYICLQLMVCSVLDYKPGKFSWCVSNLQIYDRHIEKVEEMLRRKPIPCNPSIWINPEVKDFFDFKPEDIRLDGYPIEEIKKINPQLKFDLGI